MTCVLTVKDLDLIIEMIEDPTRWCQGQNAMDWRGEPVNSTSPTSRRWCIIGAAHVVGRLGLDLEDSHADPHKVSRDFSSAWELYVRSSPNAAGRLLHYTDTPEWLDRVNDGLTHEALMDELQQFRTWLAEDHKELT